MAYNEYDVTKPEPTTQGITAYSQSIRNNDAAVRDAVVTGAFLNWNYSLPNTNSFTGSITSSTMTVTSAVAGGGIITPGMTLSGGTIVGGTVVVAYISGGTQFGSNGSIYSVSGTSSQGSTTITASQPDLALPVCYMYSKSTTEKLLSANVYNGDSNCTSAEYWYWASSTWTRIGKETFTYDGSQNVTASTWS